MTEPRTLHKKLAQVMYEAESIPKNGNFKKPGEYGHFKFVQVGDAANVIRKALAEKNVSMIPTGIELLSESEHETKSGGTMTTMTVRTTWTLTDGESGETAVIQSMGSGADSGDKASPKAQTNAMKYALLMGFLLSTGDDPELSDSSDRQTKPLDPAGESLVSLGIHTRTGAIARGAGRHSGLDSRQTPDGNYHVGWRLEVGDGKALPQCYVDGVLATALLAFYDMDPDKMLGLKVTVTGEVFEVRAEKRRPIHRMHVQAIETPDLILPAPDREGVAHLTAKAEPVEAESVPMLPLDDAEKVAIAGGLA